METIGTCALQKFAFLTQRNRLIKLLWSPVAGWHLQHPHQLAIRSIISHTMTSWAFHVCVHKILKKFLQQRRIASLIVIIHNKTRMHCSSSCCTLELPFQSVAGAGQDYAQLTTNVNNTTMLTPLGIVNCTIYLSGTESKRMHFKIHMILSCRVWT